MNIFIRYAKETSWLPNNFMTKAYDDRILFILEGQGKIIFEGEEHPLSQNTLCYYPAGTSYRPVSFKETPLKFITINFDFHRDFEEVTQTMLPVKESDFTPDKVLFRDINVREGIFKNRLVIHNASAYRNMLCELVRSYNSSAHYGKRVAESILQTLCYTLLNQASEPHDELYLKLKEYLDRSYKTIRINKDISCVFGYHDYYLNKIYKKNSGTSIHKYIIDKRLEEAAHLISTTEMPICDIAFEVGFTSVAHFSTAFKSKYFVTPSDYRTGNLQKPSNLI